MKKLLVSLSCVCSLFIASLTSANATHAHGKMKEKKPAEHQQQGAHKNTCHNFDIKCAKTVTSAVAPNGDLWRLWVIKQKLYYQISTDNGESFAQIQQVKAIDEKISARNENRPKIAFDDFGGVYLSWATPREKKYTADIRFSYSADNGKTFSTPITVNNDNLLTGHSFNEMHVAANGDINIVWLDGRLSYQLRKQGKQTNGSALFLGQANFRNNQTIFTNQQLANNTCVCCRIAIDVNQSNELAILWRHIYGDNIREFALLTLDDKKTEQQPIQLSNDHWKINGCPHQGGGLSIDENNQYHMVWFNLGDKGKGIFYANSSDQGKSKSQPLSIGDLNAQAAHPHIMKNNQTVDIVWTQFNGVEHQLWHQQSNDHGISFAEAKMLASSSSASDRPFIIKSGKKNIVSWHRPKDSHWLKAL